MKKTAILLISISVVLFVLLSPLVNTASAVVSLEVKPNPGVLGTTTVFTFIVGGEGDVYLWRRCLLFVDWGDATTPQIVGRLEPQPQQEGAWLKVFWHKYSKPGTFRIVVRGDSCDPAPRYLIEEIKIVMPEPLKLPLRKDPPLVR
jgi:hypothetical protein